MVMLKGTVVFTIIIAYSISSIQCGSGRFGLPSFFSRSKSKTKEDEPTTIDHLVETMKKFIGSLYSYSSGFNTTDDLKEYGEDRIKIHSKFRLYIKNVLKSKQFVNEYEKFAKITESVIGKYMKQVTDTTNRIFMPEEQARKKFQEACDGLIKSLQIHGESAPEYRSRITTAETLVRDKIKAFKQSVTDQMDTFNERQDELKKGSSISESKNESLPFQSASAGAGHEKPPDNSSVSDDVSASEIPAQNNKQGAVLPATADHLSSNSDHQSLHKSPSQSQSSPKKKPENYPIQDLIPSTPSASEKKPPRSSSSSESSDESVSGNPTTNKDSHTKSDRNNNEGENHQSLHRSPSQSQSSPKKKTENHPPPQTENSPIADVITFSPSGSQKKSPRPSSSSSESSDESVSGKPTPNKDSHTKSDRNNNEGENPAPILPLFVAKPDKSAPSLEKSDSKKQNHGDEEANRADNGHTVGLATTGDLAQRTKSISRSNSESRNTLPEKHHAEIKVPNDTHGQIKIDHDNSQSSRSSSSAPEDESAKNKHTSGELAGILRSLTDGSNDDHVKQKEPVQQIAESQPVILNHSDSDAGKEKKTVKKTSSSESENQSSTNHDEQNTIIPAIFDAAPKSQDKKSDHSGSDISHKEQHVQHEIHIDKHGSKSNSNASDLSHTHKHDSSSHSSKSSKSHEDQITPKEVADQNEVIYNVSEHFVRKDSSAQHEHDTLQFDGPLHIRPEKPTSKDMSSAQNQGHDGSHSASDMHLVQNKEHDGSHSGSDVHLVEIKSHDRSHSTSSHSDHSSGDKERNKEIEHVKEAGSSEQKNNLLLDLFPGLTNTHPEQPTSNDSNKGLHKEHDGNRSLSGHSGSSSDKSESKKLIKNNTVKDSSKKKDDHEVLHFPGPVEIIPEQPVSKTVSDPNTHAKKEHDGSSSSSDHSAHRSDNNKGKKSAEENEIKKNSSQQKDDHNILPSFSLPILLSGKHDSHDSDAKEKKGHNESHSASDHSANSNGNKARDLKLHEIKTPKDSSQQKDSGDAFKKDLEHRQEHDDIHGYSLDTDLQHGYIAVPVPKKKKKKDRTQDDGDGEKKETQETKAKKDEEKDNSSSASSLSSSSSISSDSSSDEDGSDKKDNHSKNGSKSASEKPEKGEAISPGKKKPKKIEFPVPYDESASEKSHRIVTSPKTPEKIKARSLDSNSVDYSEIVDRSPKQSSKRENKTNDSDSNSHKPIEITGDLGKPKSKKKGISGSDSESNQSGRSKDKKSKKKKQSGNNSESDESAKSKDKKSKKKKNNSDGGSGSDESAKSKGKKSKKKNNNSDGGSGSTESFKSIGKPKSPRSPKKAEKEKHNSSSNSSSDESVNSKKHKKKKSGSDESSQNTDDENKHDDGQLQTPQGWAGWIAAAPSNLLWGAWARIPSRETVWNMAPSRQSIAARFGYGAAQPAPQQPVKA